MYERSCAEINVAALTANASIIRKLVPPAAAVMAVVKANGYGHGAPAAAKAALAGGAAWLGVATADEGIALRKDGINAPILLLSPIFAAELFGALTHKLTLCIPDEAHAEQASAQARALGMVAEVHCKIDTGMRRIGFPFDKPEAILRVASLPSLRVTGLFSHFAESDTPISSFTDEQYARFLSAVETLRQHGLEVPFRHIANSAAVLRGGYELDLVRTGITLYGINPLGEADLSAFRALGFTPALTWKTRLSFTKSLPPGESVGYGRTFTTKRRTDIATISIGYADGFSRLFSNCGRVLVRGQFASIVGNVCMDQTMLDVTDIPGAAMGDEVVLIGKQNGNEHTVESVASQLQTIAYEVVTGLSPRVPRVNIS